MVARECEQVAGFDAELDSEDGSDIDCDHVDDKNPFEPLIPLVIDDNERVLAILVVEVDVGLGNFEAH